MDKKNGTGTFNYPSGDIYTGFWKDDRPEGQGKRTYVDGRIESGNWHLGLFVGGCAVEPAKIKVHTVEEVGEYAGTYVGTLIGGKRWGEGTFTYSLTCHLKVCK